ncbi:peptidyl-prolyl cis-trans isomerase ssp-1 [Seiridium cupressi]
MALNHSSTSAGAAVAKPADKIRAAHLLVKHRESRRPASWRESEITRSKEEARDIIKNHEARIKRGEVSLGELALTESDCSSARKRGDLGYFGKGDMQKEFEEAAFALQPGQMSTVVETQSGLHLIERVLMFTLGLILNRGSLVPEAEADSCFPLKKTNRTSRCTGISKSRA